jgi:hypothetical protein
MGPGLRRDDGIGGGRGGRRGAAASDGRAFVVGGGGGGGGERTLPVGDRAFPQERLDVRVGGGKAARAEAVDLAVGLGVLQAIAPVIARAGRAAARLDELAAAVGGHVAQHLVAVGIGHCGHWNAPAPGWWRIARFTIAARAHQNGARPDGVTDAVARPT